MTLSYENYDLIRGKCGELDAGNYNIIFGNVVIKGDESQELNENDGRCFKDNNEKQFEMKIEGKNMKIRECPSGCNDTWTACQ